MLIASFVLTLRQAFWNLDLSHSSEIYSMRCIAVSIVQIKNFIFKRGDSLPEQVVKPETESSSLEIHTGNLLNIVWFWLYYPLVLIEKWDIDGHGMLKNEWYSHVSSSETIFALWFPCSGRDRHQQPFWAKEMKTEKKK